MTCGVYKIESPSGKKYIGSSVNIAKRWRVHKGLLRAGKHDCVALQRACNKYGEEALHFEVLFECERSQLIKMEQWCIDWFGHKHLYNPSRRLYNTSGIAGKVEMTPEVRKKIGEATRNSSTETRAKSAATWRRRYEAGELVIDTSKQIAAMNTPEAHAKQAATLRRKYEAGEIDMSKVITAMNTPEAHAKGAATRRRKYATGELVANTSKATATRRLNRLMMRAVARLDTSKLKTVHSDEIQWRAAA